MKTFFFCSSPNFGQKMGPYLREILFLIYLFVLHLILGARHRSSYHLEKFLSEALDSLIMLRSATNVAFAFLEWVRDKVVELFQDCARVDIVTI